MKIGFIGDIHGRVFHAIAAISMWQIINNQKLDMIIQVGDFGAYPNPDASMLNNKFVLQDSTELDFSKYIRAEIGLKDNLKFVRQLLKSPIYFIRGNHEDFGWLDFISQNGTKVASIDEFDLIRYVPDGTVITFNGMKFAFLGGIETNEEEIKSINVSKYKELIKLKLGYIDVLVTHDSPYGTGIGFTGEVQGSRKITELVEVMQPKYLIAGHYHHMIGPQIYGKTKYMGLNILIPPKRKDKLRCVQPGSIGILDFEKGTLKFVEDEWLSQIDKDFDFSDFTKGLKLDNNKNNGGY